MYNNITNRAYSIDYDLSNCDQEPLHLIRLVQPHAVLLAVDLSSSRIIHHSQNAAVFFDQCTNDLLGKDLRSCLSSHLADKLLSAAHGGQLSANNPYPLPQQADKKQQPWQLIAHLNKQGFLILAIEPQDPNHQSAEFLRHLDTSIQRIQTASETDALLQVASQQIKQLTGYDRVMIYQFDEEYNGKVVAETVEENYEQFFGLHYPSTDIPPQARQAYFRNKTRIIVDVNANPAPILPALHPETQDPLDVGQLDARGVSPIHLEYLRNMGVQASMSTAIIVNERLWGLIACHHHTPKLVEYRVRQLIQFIGTILSGHLGLKSANLYRKQVLETNLVRSQLFAKMRQDWNLAKGLIEGEPNLLDLNSCSGAALWMDDQLYVRGQTPGQKEIQDLIQWLKEHQPDPVFRTNSLAAHWQDAAAFANTASGLLAIRISNATNDYLLWFKPEKRQTVNWGGNPQKAINPTENGMRISPRKSFEKWKEVVHNTAIDWLPHEVDVALSLRNDIKDFLIQQYQETKKINRELTEAYEELDSFSYTVSHDLRAPLRIIKGYSEILQEDYGDQLDDYGKEVVSTIISSAGKMKNFINSLLDFARSGRNKLSITSIDLRRSIGEVWKELILLEPRNRNLNLILPEKLPLIYGDRIMIRYLIQNLLSNAVKYTRNQAEAVVTVKAKESTDFCTISLGDNGIGFDMKYAKQIFAPFNRLVSADDYEGTGIGMAIAKRIIDRHGGGISVESQVNKGTTFYFNLPTNMDILAGR